MRNLSEKELEVLRNLKKCEGGDYDNIFEKVIKSEKKLEVVKTIKELQDENYISGLNINLDNPLSTKIDDIFLLSEKSYSALGIDITSIKEKLLEKINSRTLFAEEIYEKLSEDEKIILAKMIKNNQLIGLKIQMSKSKALDTIKKIGEVRRIY